MCDPLEKFCSAQPDTTTTYIYLLFFFLLLSYCDSFCYKDKLDKYLLYALFRVCVFNLSTITNKFEKYQRNIIYINENPYSSVPGIRDRDRLRSTYIYMGTY